MHRPSTLRQIAATDLLDFQRLTERELTILASIPYQIKLSLSYFVEAMDDDHNVALSLVRETEVAGGRRAVRFDIRSRHINGKTYRLFMEYVPGWNELDGITAHWCECPNGDRTAAAAIYYMAFARHQETIRRPAEALVPIFLREDEIDSDEPAELACSWSERVIRKIPNDED